MTTPPLTANLAELGPIFLIEDDADVADVFRRALEEEGFRVRVCATAGAFRREVASVRPALAVVDLGLPDADGLALLQGVLADLSAPSIIVSGRGGLDDRLAGLDVGADDYLVKPVEPRELAARVKAVLRRARSAPAEEGRSRDIASFAGWRVDLKRLSMTGPDGETQSLSQADAALLRVFLEAKGRVLSRDFLLEACGGADQNFDRSIDVRISRLRKKLGEAPQKATIIRTVYGAGYVLSPPVSWSGE